MDRGFCVRLLIKLEPELKETEPPSPARSRYLHCPEFRLLLSRYCAAPRRNEQTSMKSPGWKAFDRANRYAFQEEEERFRELGFTGNFEGKVMLNIRAMIKRLSKTVAKPMA